MNRVYALMMMAFAAQAACADDGWLGFSTEGPDTYSDGSPVLAGESYALVWTANGSFGGIAADGSAAVEGDRVIVSAPVATHGERGMHCPEVLFQVKSSTLAELGDEGGFSVVLLDTRIRVGDAIVPAPRSSGRPTVVNGWGMASGTVRQVAGCTAPKGDGEGKRACAMAVAPAGTPQPAIKAIALDGDNVVLTVENLGGYVRAQGGAEISADEVAGPAQSDATGADITIVMPKPGDERGFFRVIGS